MRGSVAAALAVTLCALASLAGSSPALAQSAAQPGFEFTPALERSLGRLRALSMDVLAMPVASDARDALLAEARALSFPRLPDQSLAASWRAVRAAEAGDAAAARRALDDAERLDPGRAETEFAAARVALGSGEWFSWLAHQGAAYWRLLTEAESGRAARHDLLTWLVLSGLLTGLLFVAASVAVRGHQQWEVLRRSLARFLPAAVAASLAGLGLAWPLVLPHGLAVLVLLWSVLLWDRASPSERVALTLITLLYCQTPALVARHQRAFDLAASPANRALHGLASGRLSGTFFSDLAVLRATVPDEPAVRQLVGDVHRRFGQWEYARRAYADLILTDGDNADALIGLGAYYFQRGDAKRAIELFEKAGQVNPKSAEAFFNLSQAFSAGYLFDESRRALARATAIDAGLVGVWIASPPSGRVVVPDGGLRRRGLIAEALAARRPPARFSRLPLWTLGLAAALLLIALGWAAALAARRVELPESAKARRRTELPPAWQTVLPAFASIAEGRALRAIGALLPVAILSLALFAERWAQGAPLALGSGWTLPRVLAILGLVLWVVLRWLFLRRREA